MESNKFHILVVDDDDDAREVMRRTLRAGGLSVVEARSGEEALSLVHEVNPSIITLDVMMPGLDGPDTLQELRKLPGMDAKPVIFMTAKVMDSEVQRSLDLGAIGVIPKPFDPMSLAQQVTTIWQESDSGK